MYKLNFLQSPEIKELNFDSNISLHPLKSNDKVEDFIKNFREKFSFKSLNTIRFSEDGILSILLKLSGKIAVSLGESQAIIDASKKYKEMGFDLEFISLKKDGTLDYENLGKFDYVFVSSYIMDTYIKVDIQEIKKLTQAKIISNESATLNRGFSDILILDAFKLTGYALSSVILHDEEFEEQYIGDIDTVAIYAIYNALSNFKTQTSYKATFKSALEEELQNDIHFFVDENLTLDYTLHFGLKGIKAREIIRTLSLNNIFVTNGEGCSLGLSKPSRILQEMGYAELESRWALSLSFTQELTQDDINTIVKTISKKYRQIKALND